MSPWRTMARECYDFFAGSQWAQEDMLVLQEQQRPIVTFNRIARTCNAVSGLEIQGRQEIRCLPRETSDNGYSEMMTNTIKWIRESCDAEDEESEMFMDNLICGMGWSEIKPQVENTTRIIIGRIDPMDVVVDPLARKPNHVDAKFVARIKEMTRREFNEQFPGEPYSTSNFWNSDIEGAPHDADNDWKYENDQSDKLNRNKTTWVAQYQYWEKQPFYKVGMPDGSMQDLPAKAFKKLKGDLDAMGLRYVKYMKKVYKECFVNSVKILEEKDLGCDHFTLQGITGFRDRNKNTWFGLVSLMLDPQRWANKWLSQIQHIVNTNAKNGYFFETGTFASPRKAEQDIAKPGSLTEVRPGGLEKILPKAAPSYPDGVDRLLQYALSSINDISGVNLELIGLADRDQPFVLEESRKQAGITVLAPLFNSLRRSRKIQGRILNYMIREYLPDGELVRINGPQGAQFVPLVKDKLAFDYDIIIDDAPTSPNMKERIYPILNQTVQLALQAGIPVPPDILDFAPLPENLTQKWKQMIMSKQNDPTIQQQKQMQMALQQLDLQQRQANIQKTGSEITANYAKAEQAHATGQDEAAQAMQKMDITNNEFQMKQQQMFQEQQRKDLELLLNERRKNIELRMNAERQQQQQETIIN